MNDSYSPRVLVSHNCDEQPKRPFFPFGNPFQKDLTCSQSIFQYQLFLRKHSETHCNIKFLVTELELPVNEWDDKWIDVYLDASVKLLDLCIAFSSEIARLNQIHVLLQFALHHLESVSSQQFERALSLFDGWRQNFNSRNTRIENSFSIIDKLVESLDLPKVVTVYICSLFDAALSGSTGKLLDLPVSDEYLWAQALTGFQNSMNQEMRSRYSNGSCTISKDLEAVDSSVNKLHPIIQDGVSIVEQEFPSIISNFHNIAENLSQGLDLLAKEVDRFFQVV